MSPLNYSGNELACIAASVFMVGMNKGGFPIGSVALPVLILIWPGDVEPAKTAVAFLLPVLCIMDVLALVFYRKHILWRRVWPLVPGALVGVVVATPVFVPKYGAMFAVPDNAIKFSIGIIGILFVMHRAAQKWILNRVADAGEPGRARSTLLGFAAGVVSTLSHGAGPIAQMYFLPQKLGKMNFAATFAAFFFVLNLAKLIPFTAFGRIESENLLLAMYLSPVIPLGVAAGYGLVHAMAPRYYVTMIYAVLFVTSVLLLVKAVQG